MENSFRSIHCCSARIWGPLRDSKQSCSLNLGNQFSARLDQFCTHSEPKLKKKLVQQKVIEPVPYSDWAAPIVAVMKPEKTSILICGDFKLTVNRITKVDRYQINDLFATLLGGRTFSKLNLSQAYQQLELDEDSKRYTTINTHKGLFRVHRLPFGVSSVPGIFQRTTESVLSRIPNVILYLDDILVSGISKEEHLHTLSTVFVRLQTAGLRLKRSKCKFLEKGISYVGHRIDSKGLHPLTNVAHLYVYPLPSASQHVSDPAQRQVCAQTPA